MICQHCNTAIDDDLVFCTNCGQRLFQQNTSEMATVVQARPAETTVVKRSSPILWVLLGILLIAIPAVLVGVYFLLLPAKPTAATNTAKSPTPAKSATPKANTNLAWKPTPSPSPANTDAAVSENSNVAATEENREEIVRERIEIEPNSHYALSFSSGGNRDIIGTVKVVRGVEVAGFVFSQEMYDEHFPDETYKVFSFGPGKNLDVRQRLVEEDYVLVLVNDSDKPTLIETDFYLK